MIIDIHGHLGNINQAPFWAADAKQLEQYCQKAGVDLLCISSAKSIMYDAMEGNRELDAALKNSERLLGYVTVSPVFPESADDLCLLKSNPKFKGVKVHPDYHGFDMASPRVAYWIGLRKVELMPSMFLHAGTGFADAVRVAELPRHPRTNFIMAHIAGFFQNGNYPYFPNLQGCENVAAMKLENVFIDTAHFLMYVYPGVMEKMVAIVGANHIVFGTDAPLQGPMQMRFAIEVIQSLNIPQRDKELILSGNAKKLLKLK